MDFSLKRGGKKATGGFPVRCWFWAALCLLAGGCAAPVRWTGPTTRAAVSARAWDGAGPSARVYESPHYRIFTTLDRPELLDDLMQTLEGAYAHYRLLSGPIPPSRARMVGLLFADRAQWAAHTRAHGGSGAEIYLKIVRGGYTLEDRFVSYYLGDNTTLSVAAHEGWHQYLARHMRGRLPPFLEEGFACAFENLRWEGGLPRWDLSNNPRRRASLDYAVRAKIAWPLAELVGMHAGQTVDAPPDRIEAFYAQSWAFATFLQYAENGRYRGALARLFRDTAAGVTVDPGGSMARQDVAWNPADVRPLLEYYLQMPFGEIERAYERHVRTLLGRGP